MSHWKIVAVLGMGCLAWFGKDRLQRHDVSVALKKETSVEQTTTNPFRAAPNPNMDSTPEGLTPSGWANIQEQVAREQHRFEKTGREWKASNTKNQYEISIEADGELELELANQQGTSVVTMELVRWGRGELHRVPEVKSVENPMPDRVVLGRSGLTEWYQHRPQGLEQGFEIAQRVAGSGELVLEFLVDGADVKSDGAELLLASAGATLRMNGLKAWDAQGRSVPARFDSEHGYRLIVDDSNAVYPMTIDPLITNEDRALFLQQDDVTQASFGRSVSVDETTGVAIVGATNWGVGGISRERAYMFHRVAGPMGSWSLVQTLRGENVEGTHGFAQNVYTDGRIAVVSAQFEFEGGVSSGAVYVYDKDYQGAVDSWGLEKRIVPGDGVNGGNFGISIDCDGADCLIGAPGDNDNGAAAGAAYLYRANQGGVGNWGLVKKLVASDGAFQDVFGTSVAIQGRYAVVGAPNATSGGRVSQGVAYIFEQNTGGADNWGEANKLEPSNGSTNNRFGTAVAIDSGLTVVGSPYFSNFIGSVYLFEENRGGVGAWGEYKQLFASDGSSNDFFGEAISMSGTNLLVASRLAGVYLFQQDTGGIFNWGEERKFEGGSDGVAGDLFGNGAVAISGDLMIVGARGSNTDGLGSGAAYVFSRNTGGPNAWGEQDRLASLDQYVNGTFGQSMSLDGDLLLVGMAGQDESGLDSGSAYLFARNEGGIDNWGLRKSFVSPAGVPNASYGWVVALEDGVAAISASEPTLLGSGVVHVYEEDAGGVGNWGLVRTLEPADSTAIFGNSLALSQGRMVVGAQGDGDNGVYSGSVYVFEQDFGGLSNWGMVRKMLAPDGASNDGLGTVVAIDGERILASSPGAIGNDTDSGAVYMYGKDQGGVDNWGFVKKLIPSGLDATDTGWMSLALDGPTAAIGVIGDDGFEGRVYIFSENSGGLGNWGEATTIASPIPPGNLVGFGGALVLEGQNLVVSSGGFYIIPGEVFVYGENAGGPGNWGEVKRLATTQTAYNFGSGMALDGERLFVSDPYLDHSMAIAPVAGAVFLFGMADTDGDGVHDEHDNAPMNNAACLDEDMDGCDDCILSGPLGYGAMPDNDGPDSDGDGQCDLGDDDDDDDGLTDAEEMTLGSDPTNPDTDGDGVNDGDEMNPGDDPDMDGVNNIRDADSDNDGLSDGDEGTHGTDPFDPDSDDGGVRDGAEVASGTNPNDPGDDNQVIDTDGDGVSDAEEEQAGTNPKDKDSDDDGIFDGDEPNFNFDDDGDKLVNMLDADSDGDGLFDGTEMGLTRRDIDEEHTSYRAGAFIEDADPSTTTNMILWDTDGGSLRDGAEDENRNGRVDPGERNPVDDPVDDTPFPPDNDGDGLFDVEELALGTDPADTDSDDDGISDGAEPNYGADTDDDGRINALDWDSDDDGILDGIEFGLTEPMVPVDTDRSLCLDSSSRPFDGCFFQPDADPSTTTNMLSPHSDLPGTLGGIPDGLEDQNWDGAFDSGEGDPTDPSDDLTLIIPEDSDGDFIRDIDEGAGDRDNDGIPNYLDTDADGDGIPDEEESGCSMVCSDPTNSDFGGVPDYLDVDSDDDSIRDDDEDTNDDDNDGVPNYQDRDSDNDFISDEEETDGDAKLDTDGDGIPNFEDIDSDGDTISDADEAGDGDLRTEAIDTDGDEVPNYVDLDSDGDGISDADEAGDDDLNTPPVDTDGDGVPDYLQADSDSDGVDDDEDNCRFVPNPLQEDTYGETGVGDACEEKLDEGCCSGSAPSGGTLLLLGLMGVGLCRSRLGLSR